MAGKLIVIEASDGCGKSTQANRLVERLLAEGKHVRKVQFPNYQSPSSALIKMYLGGDFGSSPQAVNAFAASAFYAVDRYASFKQDWEEFYLQGGIVVCDRYTTSNMVHQAVKIEQVDEREAYLAWLCDFEFIKLKLPVPDLVILLDMPPQYSADLIQRRADQQGYGTDIHECDHDYLARCYGGYQEIAQKYHWRQVPCVYNDALRSIEDIHADIYKITVKVL